MIGRIFENTRKQIARSGWSAWASISVMVLAFLVACIFGGLAYVSNLYIQYIESKSNLLVFFEEGMDKQVVDGLQNTWSQNTKIKNITYTSEEEAYQMYADYTAVVQKEIYAVLKTKETKTLPSSLDVQIYSLADLDSVKSQLQKDIEDANSSLIIVNTSSDSSVSSSVPNSYATAGLPTSYPMYKYSQDPTQKPINLKVDDESLDQLRQVLYFLRLVGIIVLAILFIGVFFFTFMAVEFRLQGQMEEIGVMQLVGGSLFFIRSPYILEGGFYGAVGALISSIMIGAFLVIVFVFNKTSTVTVFLFKIFNKLPWPNITLLGVFAVIAFLCLIGFLLGGISSYLSIRRYIR